MFQLVDRFLNLFGATTPICLLCYFLAICVFELFTLIFHSLDCVDCIATCFDFTVFIFKLPVCLVKLVVRSEIYSDLGSVPLARLLSVMLVFFLPEAHTSARLRC